MLRTLCLLLTALLLPAGLFAQSTYSLKGFMGVQGGESFTYRLDLKDSAGNLLSGYAYTYLDEKKDVKAYVIAEADRSQKTLKIRETTIVHNHYFQSRATICLVEALLSYSAAEKNLSGPLITMTAGNGASCARGSISFSNTAELEQLFHPAQTEKTPPVTAVKTEPKKPARVIYDTTTKARQPKPAVVQPAKPVAKQPDQITEGKDKTYYWEDSEIVLELWDGNNEDNDQVTILYNGETVLQHYILKREHKQLHLPVGGNGLNIITVIAENEGGDPPNTANILLRDGDTSYEIIAHNTIGKKALIRIRKKL